MNVQIENGCIGCGLCAGTCPSVFRMEGGVAKVFEQPSKSEQAAAQEAADGCPVNVIITQ